MFQFCTFASSSAGNAALLTCGSRHFLIDAGISWTRIRRCLAGFGLTMEDLSALFITHIHSDHTAGLATILKRHSIPIRCSRQTAAQLARRWEGAGAVLEPFEAGDTILVEGCVVTSIPLSHDAWGACGYRFDWQGRSLGVLTDTGIVPEAAACLEGVDILLLEANHDVEALLSGPYPYDLKERVMGRQGHLSNEAAAQFAAACALAGTRDIILAHLSEENNTPQMARSAVGRALEAVGYQGRLSVAPRREMGEVHVLEVAECSVSR